MKALHVQVFRCEGMVDWIHGGGAYADAIFVPEKELLIECTDGNAFAAQGALERFASDSPGGEKLRPKVIKEVDVPDDIVASAAAYLETRKMFSTRTSAVWKTLVSK